MSDETAHDDLARRLMDAVGEREQRETVDELAARLARDPNDAAQAAASLLRTAAARLRAADVSASTDPRAVARDLAEALTALVDPVGTLLEHLEPDSVLVDVAAALETAAGGLRAVEEGMS